MADIPNLRSKEQIIADLINSFKARNPIITDFNQSSVVRQIFEATGQSHFKAEANVIGMISALSVDRATGEALQRMARDANVPIYPARASTTSVDISDVSFTKKSTFIYTGRSAPVAGSLEIYTTDASAFPTTGKVYVGRGTSNFEGPLEYTAISSESGGAYFKITLAVTSPTTKFHNISEAVTLSQGGTRYIKSGTVVQTATGANAQPVLFSTTADAYIADGETTVTGIPVVCQEVGTKGNAPKGSIKSAIGLAFESAVFNSLDVTNGREADTEEDIKTRIKAYEQAKAKGIASAIKFAAIDVIAPDEQKRVQSANTVRYTDGSVSLVFDDGAGYEPNYIGAGLETVIDDAVGGETELQLRQYPVAQSRVKCITEGPYTIIDNSILTVDIKGIVTTPHVFKTSSFRVPSSATAFEVATSINANPNIQFSATTANNGKRVVIYPRDRSINEIEVVRSVGVDANDVLQFPFANEQSLRLYKNDFPLYQDGQVAKVSTKAKSLWSSSISSGDTLTYTVDGTTSITVTLTDQDFQEINPTYVMSANRDIDTWIEVFNNTMPGLTAVINQDKIDFISNLGESDRAAVEFTGGTLWYSIFNLNLSTESLGRASDYTFNKETGQVELKEALASGDKISAGSQYTKAYVQTSSIPNGVASGGEVYLIVDGSVDKVNTGITPSSLITFNKNNLTNKLTISATDANLTPAGFENAIVGDWLLVWANASDSSILTSNAGYWRIESITGSTIVMHDMKSRSNGTISILPDRIQIVRSDAPIQKISYSASNLSALATSIETQLEGVKAEIVGGTIRISTKTESDNGQIYVVAVNQDAAVLGLPVRSTISNVSSHYGFNSTQSSEQGIPSFTHGNIVTNPTLTLDGSPIYQDASYKDVGSTGHDLIEFLDRTSTSNEIWPDSIRKYYGLIRKSDPAIDGLVIKMPKYVKASGPLTETGLAIQEGDRFFLRQGFQFDSEDSISAVLDGDAATKSFKLPTSRKLKVNGISTPTTSTFSADDKESSLALSNIASFNDFSFSDFKALRQAHQELTNGTYSIKVKALDFGKSNRTIGLAYPKTNSDTSIKVVYDNVDQTGLEIRLPVKTARNANWDSTTCFEVTQVTLQGKQTITYTYKVGTQPDFLAASVQVGDIVNILTAADFRDVNKDLTGIISAVTTTSFSIELPFRSAISETLAALAINQNGTMTITTPSPHGLKSGQRIGLYDTSISTGITRPLNGTYVVTVTGLSTFTVVAPLTAPGGSISLASHLSNVVTFTTAAAHNLNAGNIITVSGVGGSYDGTSAVLAVLNANQFTVTKNGSSASVANSGRVDYQSIAPTTTAAAITSAAKASNLVTVTTSTPHLLSAGQLVQIQGMSLDLWSNVTNYGIGDLVRFGIQSYISLSVNVGLQPNISPSDWLATTQDLNGTFVINSASGSTLTYYYQSSGNASATAGNAIKVEQQGMIARSLGTGLTSNLQIAQVQATAQEIVDFITSDMADSMTATTSTPNAIISNSTTDNGRLANYITASVSQVEIFKSSRKAILTVNQDIKAGSTVTISGLAGQLTSLNDKFAVLERKVNGGNWDITIQAKSFFHNASVTATSGSIIGYNSRMKLVDGENVILNNNLQSSPQFNLRDAWEEAPAVTEEVRLVACTVDHLNRFWNKLVVSGITNVGTLTATEYGKQIQITSKTFGSNGSVKVNGGLANSLITPILGTSSENGGFGLIYTPYASRKGYVNGQWLSLENQVRQNKKVGFSQTTVLQFSNATGNKTITINSGTGTFETARATTQDATTLIRFERQGSFMAVMHQDGQALSLDTASVQEGDWLYLRAEAANWNVATPYIIGDRVKSQSNGLYYTCIQAHTGQNPATSTGYWVNKEIIATNRGLHKIVRVFGTNTIYIEAGDMIEGIYPIAYAGGMKIVTHDSATEGDQFIVDTDNVGNTEAGRYLIKTVTPTQVVTEYAGTDNTSQPYSLGGEYFKFNVEEKNALKLWKRISDIAKDGELAAIQLDSPNLVARITESLQGIITAHGKLGFDENTQFGVDSYKPYRGLIKQLNRIIYGDPVDTTTYPGIAASGTKILIEPAIIRRITCGLSVRLRTGVPFSQINNQIKSAVAGYVNSLDVGQSVSISRIISAASTVPGVISVAVIDPVFNAANDLIQINQHEKALILDSTVDVVVSITSA